MSWTEIKGIKYTENIVIDASGPEANVPNFRKIELIFIDDQNKLFFIVRSIRIKKFYSHVHAYKININREWLCLSYENLYRIKTSCILQDVNRDSFVVWS